MIPEEGYPGVIDKGVPLDKWAYNFWLESLPKVWHDNPFISHFLRIGDEDTVETITEYIEDVFNATTLKMLDTAVANGDVKSVKRMLSVIDRTQFATDHVKHTISATNQRFIDGFKISLDS